MRQAGRYLPEYRAAREGVSFLEACQDVDRAVEISLQPLRLVGTEAVILFSDIFVPVLGMGVELDFRPGPVIAKPVRTRADVEALAVPDPRTSVPYVFEILRRLRTTLAPEAVPLLGFAGAPFTLAAYLVEGKGSKDFAALKRMMYREPAVLRALLEQLMELTIGYLDAQIEAGAHAVQLFDTWAGLLSAGDYREWILPTHQTIARRLGSARAPLILYVNGCAHVLDSMVESGFDVLSLDWRVDFAEAARRIGDRAAVQGNLDPCALAAPPGQIQAWVRDLERAGRAARGHVLNLGHGCLPETPVEGVRAFTDAARSFS